MILNNNKAARYKCLGIVIMPGGNYLNENDQNVKDFLSHPGVKKRFEIGEFTLNKNDKEKKSIKQNDNVNEEVDFNGMSLSEIKQYIAESEDLDKLRHIANNDNRKTVVNSAQERYAEIKKKG